MIGESILHYLVLDQMGAGGMGVVYRALDTRLGRHVALKFLPEPARHDATARERLLAEAQAAARLDHPNIGVIHAIEDVDDQPFIVMALYEGESLRRRIDRAPLGVDEATDIAMQVARGLARAHAGGVVHRDVKPDNLFLAAQAPVKILDFGLAKLDRMEGLTSAGTVVGTLEYMSPEQIRGQAVDARTDLWALGLVLYEMLTGVSPFRTEGGMTANILKIIKDEPEPLLVLRPDASPTLAAVIERALVKDRDARYGSAGDMLVDLEAALRKGSAVTSLPTRVDGLAAPVPSPLAPVVATAAPTTVPPSRAQPPPASRLPRPASPLVGRDTELEIIRTNLADPHCRLLSLLGLGGTGKTRLVIEAATEAQASGAFAGGVYFVPLDPLEDADQIVPAIARVLGIDLQPQEPGLVQVQRYLAESDVLLVLDNYEHVMEGAELPSELLRACPGLRILVTSRERLNLEEEWVLPLPGLSVPPAGVSTPEDASRFKAVELFVQRAQRANVRYELEAEDVAPVGEICRLVTGSPLGIELAAPWVKMMTCAEIATEIQNSIDFLASSSRNVSERHRSIRACFEYSWTLLSPKERDVYARLAVFQGSFTREAAADVAGAKLPFLMALVDKSLLQAVGGRYDSHPQLHHYAAEKLAEDATLSADVEIRHGAYYLGYLQGTVGRDDELARLDLELPQVLAATYRAHERGDAGLLVDFMRLLAVDGGYFAARGHTPRSMALLQAAVDAAKGLDRLALAARFLGKLGDTHKLHHGEREPALAAYQESLSLSEQLDDHHRQAIMLSLIGQTRFEQGADDADAYLERAYEIARAHDDGVAMNHVLQHQGMHAAHRGQMASARALFGQALEVIHGGTDDEPNPQGALAYPVFMTLLNLGEVHRVLGEFDVALTLRQRTLRMAETRDNQLWKAYAVHELGEVFHSMNDRVRAREHFALALELWEKNGVTRKVRDLRAFMHSEGYLVDARAGLSSSSTRTLS